MSLFFSCSTSGETFGSGEHYLLNLACTDNCLAPLFIFFSKDSNSASIFVIETVQLAKYLRGVAQKNGNVNFRKNAKRRILLGILQWAKIKTKTLWPECMTDNSVKQEIHQRLNQRFFKSRRTNRFTFINVHQLLNKFAGSCFFVKLPLM